MPMASRSFLLTHSLCRVKDRVEKAKRKAKAKPKNKTVSRSLKLQLAVLGPDSVTGATSFMELEKTASRVTSRVEPSG